MRSRWGTLSVQDYKDPRTLIPEILLYDRLIMPIPGSNDEWPRWKEQGWDPKRLTERVLQLDNLVEQVLWGGALLDEWGVKKKAADAKLDLQDERKEVKEALPYMLTRRVLAQGRRYVDRDGIAPEVVAAYSVGDGTPCRTTRSTRSLDEDVDMNMRPCSPQYGNYAWTSLRSRNTAAVLCL